MKRLLLSSALIATLAGAGAQTALDWGGVPIVPESYGHNISRDGKISAGETLDGSCFTRDNVTGQLSYYLECSAGMGNCIASNGWVVGADKNSMKSVILYNGKIQSVPSLSKYTESYLNGITWDGTRLCGILSNPDISPDDDILDPSFNKQMYMPFYCDIVDGVVGDPVLLPHPPKDFFELTPQFSSAVFISDDGKTIAGQVIDNSGRYMYPVVYVQDENGDWEYSLPSESLFNTKGLEVPQYPLPEMEAPQAWEFIEDPEERAAFLEALEEWDGDEDSDPYENLDLFMTPDEIAAFYEALDEYIQYMNYYNNEVLASYYRKVSEIVEGSTFFLENSNAMDPSGKLLAQTRLTFVLIDTNPEMIKEIHYQTPFLFNLEDGTYKILGDDESQLQINQILSDGTLIAASPIPGPNSPDITPQHSYVMAPESESFVTLEDYLKNENPTYADWMDEYLHHEVAVGSSENGALEYKDMTVTGLAAVSDDFSSISAGVDGWSWDLTSGMYFTYFLNKETAGIEGIQLPSDIEKDAVYNLQGVKVLDSASSGLNRLPHGIYIIGRKKVVL